VVVTQRAGPVTLQCDHESIASLTAFHRAKMANLAHLTRRVPTPHYPVNVMKNEQQIKGQWEQFKGKCKRAWAELTDDDFLKAEGSVDKMRGIIQERFGDSKEAIQKKFDRFATE
jgi:uncharacterized protein YjbJ (UPF0337 family)